MKPVLYKVVSRCVSAAMVLCVSLFFSSCMPIPEGELSVCVLDGWTDLPLAGARVVIPETGDVSVTDAEGRTEKFCVPILRDQHFSNILPQDWGTVTVLVYAEGYYACALYHVRVEAKTLRENLPVRLFPGDGSMGEMPFLLVEAPDSDWVNEMLGRYGP